MKMQAVMAAEVWGEFWGEATTHSLSPLLPTTGENVAQQELKVNLRILSTQPVPPLWLSSAKAQPLGLRNISTLHCSCSKRNVWELHRKCVKMVSDFITWGFIGKGEALDFIVEEFIKGLQKKEAAHFSFEFIKGLPSIFCCFIHNKVFIFY